MPEVGTIRLAKMNGLGNEIVVADLRQTAGSLSAGEIAAIGADSRWHFDQLMAIGPPGTSNTDGTIKIYNIDGSEAGACGNGMRCVGLFAAKLGAPSRQRY